MDKKREQIIIYINENAQRNKTCVFVVFVVAAVAVVAQLCKGLQDKSRK